MSTPAIVIVAVAAGLVLAFVLFARWRERALRARGPRDLGDALARGREKARGVSALEDRPAPAGGDDGDEDSSGNRGHRGIAGGDL